MISRAIANNGLPLKIQTQWTEDIYTNQDIDGNIETVDVDGWLIRSILGVTTVMTDWTGPTDTRRLKQKKAGRQQSKGPYKKRG